MEKIKINEIEFELIPMGINSTDKIRSIEVYSNMSFSNIETAFADVSHIEYLTETGDVLATYLDGVGLKSITKNLDTGTYIVIISIDAVEAELRHLRAQVAALAE